MCLHCNPITCHPILLVNPQKCPRTDRQDVVAAVEEHGLRRCCSATKGGSKTSIWTDSDTSKTPSLRVQSKAESNLHVLPPSRGERLPDLHPTCGNSGLIMRRCGCAAKLGSHESSASVFRATPWSQFRHTHAVHHVDVFVRVRNHGSRKGAVGGMGFLDLKRRM